MSLMFQCRSKWLLIIIGELKIVELILKPKICTSKYHQIFSETIIPTEFVMLASSPNLSSSSWFIISRLM